MDKKTVMLVEDNPDDVVLTLRALKKNNIANQLIVKEDGVEALEYLFDERNELPAVILLDLKLPRKDGIEVLEAIRSNPRTELIPVVVLTTSREESDVIRTYKLRVNSYIVKPVDFEHFIEATNQLGMYWLLLNVAPPKVGATDG